jgi:hypothetical protein
LAWITGFLALGTAILATFTYALWKETRRLANETVEAGRKEFIATFRPQLKVRQVAKLERDGEPIIDFVVTNAGGSPAVIREARIVVITRAKGKALPARPFSGIEPFLKDKEVVAGQAVSVTWSENADEFVLNMAEVFEAEANLFVLGEIIYADTIRIQRRMAFCRSYDNDNGRFRTLEDPDYEYAD